MPAIGLFGKKLCSVAAFFNGSGSKRSLPSAGPAPPGFCSGHLRPILHQPLGRKAQTGLPSSGMQSTGAENGVAPSPSANAAAITAGRW